MNQKAKPIDWDHLGQVIAQLQDKERWEQLLLVSCATFTGCRPADICKFTWATFLNADGTPKAKVSIVERKPEALMKAKGKKAKPRPIFLTPDFQAVLAMAWKGMSEPYLSLFMFRGTRGPKGQGISPNAVNSRFKKIAAEFGLSTDITSYSFRRTGAVRVYESAPDPATGLRLVQRLLNHKSLTTTTNYVEFGDDQTRTAFLALSFL